MRASILFLVALTTAVFLGCGGATGSVGENSGPTATADVPTTGHLIQTGDGLYDDQGRFVAPFGGKGAARDVHVFAAGTGPAMLVGDGVRVARRAAGGISVETVSPGRVTRAAGGVGFVDDGGAWRVVDTSGATLLDGYRPWDASSLDPAAPPIHLPEYWWNPAAGSLPVPVCKAKGAGADERDCAIVHADGRVEGPGLRYVTGFTTGWGRAVRDDGVTLRRPDGSGARTLPEGYDELGPVGGDGYVFLAVDAPPSQPPRFAVLAPDGTLTPAAAPTAGRYFVRDDQDISRCPGPLTTCPYRFHEGLAPVWIQTRDGFQTAYLDTAGKVAIGPEPCAGTALSGPFHDGRALMCRGDGYALIDASGAVLAGPYPTWSPKKDDASPNGYEGGLFFSDGLAAVPADGGWCYIDRDGAVVLPGPYTVARPFRLGMAAVQEGTAVKVVDRRGAVVLAKP